MSTASVARIHTDETVVRVVRSLMGWHGLAMPDIAAAIDASMGTVERRLSKNAAVRKSFLGFELQMLADYFGVPVECFYTGAVNLQESRLSVTPDGSFRRISRPTIGEFATAA